MGYLRAKDYSKQIQTDNLNQIISSDNTILAGAELAAQAELTSYLTQKYDVTKEFTETFAFDVAIAYKGRQRVEYLTEYYYVTLPHEEFNYEKNYKVGDQVWWKDKVYTCQIATTQLSHSERIQYPYISSIPVSRNIFPDDPEKGVQYWGSGTAYSVTAGTLPTNTTKWTKGDNRDQQLVMFMVDVTLYHLHSRIAPRNIPQLRMDRYDMAVSWLKMAAKGQITAALPIIQPKTGSRVRYGGQPKNINHW